MREILIAFSIPIGCTLLCLAGFVKNVLLA